MAGPRPRNVLLITADQMRRDHVGCYGNPVIRTPHLDRIAAGGTRIDRAYVSNPVCMPNRSTMATGRLPRNHRCWSNGIALPTDERTVADVLNARGYHTALLGKAHFNNYGSGAAAPEPNRESRAAWAAGRYSADWTGPYYGFSEVQLALGHGPWGCAHAHYGRFLEENYPDVVHMNVPRRPSPTGALQSFTPEMPVESHCSSWLGRVGTDYLRRRADDGRPFFCWVSFPDPHHAFCPPAPYDTMYDPADVVMPRLGPEALDDKPPHFRRAHEAGELWEGIGRGEVLKDITEPQLREIIARTYGMVTLLDENVGRLLAALDETGLAEDTVVCFTSDHGDLMGDCGLLFKGPLLLEGLIGVPMLFRVPGAAGGAGEGLMNTVDLAPTLLALLGADVPGWMDSRGEADLARGGRSTRDAAFVEFRSMYRPEMNLRSVVTADRRLTHYAGLDCGELYDLTADVPEARNLWSAKEFSADRARLERRLLREEILRQDTKHWPVCHA